MPESNGAPASAGLRHTPAEGGAPRRGELFLLTFSILALELAIIRWMSQQVRLFGYLNNVILIAAFLGSGLGIGAGRCRPELFAWTLPLLGLLAALLAFAGPLGLIHLSLPDDAIQMWGLRPVGTYAGNLSVVLALFTAVALVFLCAGSRVGAIFAESEALAAYSVDLAGSFVGVIAMALLSAAQTPPPAWLAVATVSLAWFARRWFAWVSFAMVIVLSWLSITGASFSPYYRIDLARAYGITGAPLRLSVNRDFHQYIYDLSERRLSDRSLDPNLRWRLRATEVTYRLPFLLSPNKGDALVVGAGTGNDVAAALRDGFRRVVAVEIDPRIVQIGRQMHPERPYDDSRADVVVNDARAYFEQNRGARFDSIAFGLLDSHAVFSAMSSLRLDNYVYTLQSIRAAWRQLRSPGVLSISFASGGTPWLSYRLYALLRDGTGAEPIVMPHSLQNGRFYMVAKGFDLDSLITRSHIRRLTPGEFAKSVRVPTDDWPFLYLKPAAIPYSYLIVLAAILLIAGTGGRLVFGPTMFHRGYFDPALFLMGAAFLLIETRGVTTLSLLFGSTWIVNAVVFAGILLVAFAANAFVRWHGVSDVRIPLLLLVLSLVVNYFVGPDALLPFSLLWRGIIGGIVNALPVGFAGLTFSALFSRAAEPDAAIGSNLLGAVVGGCVEYLSIAIGLRAVALIALVFYLGVMLLVVRPAPRFCAADGDQVS